MIAVHPDAQTFGEYGEDEALPGGLTVEQMAVDSVTRFDLEFHFTRSRDGQSYDGRMLYSKDLYSTDSAKRLAQQFRSVLGQVTESIEKEGSVHPGLDMRLDDFTLPNAVSSLKSYNLLHDNIAPYPRDKSLGELFKTAAIAHFDRIAVRDTDNATLTYADLDLLSDIVAHKLASLNLPSETLVGLYSPRSAAYIACILGIIKAGLAYLPLDPQLPPERVQVLSSDIPSGSLILTGNGVDVDGLVDLVGLGLRSVPMDEMTNRDHHTKPFDVVSRSHGSSLAYAM